MSSDGEESLPDLSYPPYEDEGVQDWINRWMNLRDIIEGSPIPEYIDPPPYGS